MLVWKEIVPGPGTYWYKDQETNLPRTIDFDASYVKHLHDTGKEMIASGLSVPVPQEHQEYQAMSAADRAAWNLKHNAGWTKDYRISEKGGLDAQLDIADPDIARKVGKTVLWTSPWITSFTDGKGKTWENVIGHNALTTRPRITDQKPFESLAAALSVAGGLPRLKLEAGKPLERGLAVCAAGLLVPQGGKGPGFVAKYPVAFSLLSGARLAAADMAPPKKSEGKGDSPAVKDKSSEGGDDTPSPGDESDDGPEMNSDGDISIWDVIRDLLESEGYNLPEGTNEENFAANMYTCLMDCIKSKGNPEHDMADTANQPNEGTKNNLPANPPPVQQEQPPMYMSLDDVEKIADPQLRQMARVALSLQNQAFEQARTRRQERIERVLKLDRAGGLKSLLTSALAGARLSLSTDGKVTDSMDDMLAVAEASLKNYVDVPVLLSSTRSNIVANAHPEEFKGEMSEERRVQVVNELVKGLPGSERAPAK